MLGSDTENDTITTSHVGHPATDTKEMQMPLLMLPFLPKNVPPNA